MTADTLQSISQLHDACWDRGLEPLDLPHHEEACTGRPCTRRRKTYTKSPGSEGTAGCNPGNADPRIVRLRSRGR